jgi:nucleoid-associated protein YgaU
VVAGDTLSKLAKVYLGDANRSMDLFKANTGVLADPNLVKVGQRLNIPAR